MDVDVDGSLSLSPEERQRRLLVFNVVMQNLRAIGALSLEDYLGLGSVDDKVIEDDHAGRSTSAIQTHAASSILGLGDTSFSEPQSQPVVATMVPDKDMAEPEHPSIKEIEDLCLKHTNARVRPFWLTVKDPKQSSLYGCVLRIQLSPRSWRVYSVDTTYSDPAGAKVACAEAYRDYVLQYLRTEGPKAEPDLNNLNSEPVPAMLRNEAIWTVQAYCDTLPKPLPENAGNKTASDINAPSWLNSMLQVSRGSRLSANFIWTEPNKHGLHGCLLRLSSPAECRSYLVDSRFAKRAEAKASVCLLAMSEGAGNFIRDLAKQVEDRLPLSVRKVVSSLYLPTLISECRKLRPEVQPVFEYVTEDDACGCTLTLTLGSDRSRSYTVPAEYRTRNDAKIAVVAVAVSEGVFEFIGVQPSTLFPNYAQPSAVPGVGNGAQKRKYDSMNTNGPFTPGSTDRRWKRRKQTPIGDFAQGTPVNGGNFQKHNRGKYSFPKNGQRQPWSSPFPSTSSSPYSSPYSPVPYQQPGVNGAASGYPTSPYGMTMSQPTPYMPSPSPYTTIAPGITYYPHGMASSQCAPASTSTTDTYHPSQPASAMQPYANGMPPHPPPLPASHPVTTYQPIQPSASQIPYSSATYSQPFQPYIPTPSPASPYTPTYGSSIPAPSQPYSGVPYSGLPPPPPPPPTYAQPISPVQPSAQTPSTGQSSGSANPIDSPIERKAMVKRPVQRPKPSKLSGGGKVTIAVEATPQSSVTALYDYCREAGLAAPEFRNEIVMNVSGENKHKVWVVIGKQKMELPTTFPSLSQGQEKVAKKVLEQLRSAS
ncbi:unnamed protein product [Somion occarium]|uniref:Uncharacterized protein n=1 Tax=Somion occarium TaxID=3059160 RepID=A0ABP1D709_9APHY